MNESSWERLVMLARHYSYAAFAVATIRKTSVPVVREQAKLVRSEGNDEVADRLDEQARRMEEDPIGHHYGRHQHGRLQGKPRLPTDWPKALKLEEGDWEPTNDVKANLELSRDFLIAANVAFDAEQVLVEAS